MIYELAGGWVTTTKFANIEGHKDKTEGFVAEGVKQRDTIYYHAAKLPKCGESCGRTRPLYLCTVLA